MDFGDSEKFTLFWRVENFRNSLHKKGDILSSPIILLKTFCNTRWCFNLCPKGDNRAELDDLTIFLRRENDDGPDKVEIEYELSVHSYCFRKSVRTFPKNEGFGYIKSCRDLRKLHSFMIKCNLRMSTTELSKNISKFPETYPQYPPIQPTLLVSDASKNISLKAKQEMLKAQRKFLAYPTQCFFCSRFQVEKRLFCWPIILEEDTNEQEIPIISVTSAPSLLLSLKVIEKESNQILNISMKPIEADFVSKKVFLICVISIIDHENVTIDTAEKEYLFETNEIWNFDYDFINQNKIENKFFRDLKLNCILEFSNGEISNDILYTKDIFLKKEDNSYFTGDSNKVFDYNKLNKFYDVTLCTMNKTHKAHKVVLSAVSPVFEAMFESGMKESLSNEVQISDIDSETLEKMLQFIYSGTFTDDIEYRCAIKLFSVADKYEIIHLKNLSRFILNDNLNVDNVCDILSLADAHSDPKLRDATVEFLEINKSAVLPSLKWKDFMSKNPILACDIFMDICLQLI